MTVTGIYVNALTRLGEHVGRSYFLCSKTKRGPWWIGEVRATVDGDYVWVVHPRVPHLRNLIPPRTNTAPDVALTVPVGYAESHLSIAATLGLPSLNDAGINSNSNTVPDATPPLD